LARDLGHLDITMIGVGPTIGSTIFLLLGIGTAIAGPAIILAFALNFVVTIFTAMAYMELGSAFPETGGGYLWVKDSMPQPFGFLGGWMSWFGHCIVASFYILGFGFGITWLLANYGVMPDGQCVSNCPSDIVLFRKVAAVAIGGLFIFINYRGVSTTGQTEGFLTIALIGIIGVFIAAGIMTGAGKSDPRMEFEPFIPYGPGSIILAMGFTFIVFEGYEIIAQAGEECRDPEVNIPKAQLIAIAIPTTIFILIGVAAISAADPVAAGFDPGLSGWRVVALLREFAIAEVARQVLPWMGIGLVLIVAGVILGSVAAINSMMFSSSRVSFAMARDGSLPLFLARLSEVHRTPHMAIFMSGAVIATMTLLLPIETVAGSASIMFLLLFLFVNISVIILRVKRADAKRWYKIPFFPVVPIAGIMTNFVLAFSLWSFEPAAWYTALLWISIGLLLYYIYRGRVEIAEIPAAKRMDLLEVLAAARPTVAPERYRVLVPLRDFSDRHLVEVASILAAERGGELILMHIVEVPSTLPPKSLRFSHVDDKIKELGRLERGHPREGVTIRSILKISHRVYETIIATVQEEHVDLLVLSWRGDRPGTDKRILGTNIDYLVQRAPCDVAVLKTKGMKDEVKSVLTVSGSAWHTTYATSLAALIAREKGAEMTILTVVQDPTTEAQELRYAERLRAVCEAYGVPHRLKIVRSLNLQDTVVEEARQHDLLVMGASSQWVLRRYAFGEVEDRIAKRVETPVLMLRKITRPHARSSEEVLLPGADPERAGEGRAL
jgi:amino acid transporter/nucleotide-binding universal stress UspA family protein